MDETNRHISEDIVLAYLNGDLDDEDQFLVDTHIYDCDKCADMFRRIRAIEFAASSWTAKRHGEAYRASRELFESMWEKDSGGVFRVIGIVRDQVLGGVMEAAALLFFGYRKVYSTHLGRDLETDNFSINLPEDAGRLVISVRCREEKESLCNATITPEISIEAGKGDRCMIMILREGEAPEDRPREIWEETGRSGQPFETPDLMRDRLYSIRIEQEGRAWEVPLPLKIS